jgi:hypothetical protein
VTLRYPGVVGTETVGSRTFLRFDSPESGYTGMETLLQGPGYRNLPFDAAMRRWTTGTTQPTFDPQGRPQGYDLPAMAGRLGIDRARTIASLSNDERQALVREMSVREGFSAGPPRAVGVGAAPVQVAAAAPQGGTVAFPSAAFVDQEAPSGAVAYPSPAPAAIDYRGLPFRTAVPDLTPTALGLTAPPSLGAPPTRPAGIPPAGGPLVEPETKVPLTTISTRDQHGREQTYSVPTLPSPSQAANMKIAGFDDFRRASAEQVQYWKQLEAQDDAQKKVIDADIARARGATPAENVKAQRLFANYRTALDTYQSDFPNPEDRAKYVGWLKEPLHVLKSLVVDDPRFALFLRDVAPFQYQVLDDNKGTIREDEQQELANLLPTGGESKAINHETRLQGFNDHVNLQLGILNAQLHMAPEEITPAWWNAVQQYHIDQLAADKQAADKQRIGGSVAGAAAGAALSAPPAAPPAEAPPATVVVAPPGPVAPPPFTVLGHWQE